MLKYLRSLWHYWDDDICGDWTENKLISRKWLLVFSVIYIAICADFSGHELGTNTTQVITIVVPSFVTIQGFVDMIKYRKAQQRARRKDNDS